MGYKKQVLFKLKKYIYFNIVYILFVNKDIQFFKLSNISLFQLICNFKHKINNINLNFYRRIYLLSKNSLLFIFLLKKYISVKRIIIFWVNNIFWLTIYFRYLFINKQFLNSNFKSISNVLSYKNIKKTISIFLQKFTNFFIFKKYYFLNFYIKLSNMNYFKYINMYIIHRKFIMLSTSTSKLFKYFTTIYLESLIKFFEYVMGMRVIVYLKRFNFKIFNLLEKIIISLQTKYFYTLKFLIPHKIEYRFLLEILFLAFKLKNIKILSNILAKIFKNVYFWRYRNFFFLLKKYILFLFLIYLKDLNYLGIKIKIKGKIGTSGNSRTKILQLLCGQTKKSTSSFRIVHDYRVIPTFTGCIGINIWFIF